MNRVEEKIKKLMEVHQDLDDLTSSEETELKHYYRVDSEISYRKEDYQPSGGQYESRRN